MNRARSFAAPLLAAVLSVGLPTAGAAEIIRMGGGGHDRPALFPHSVQSVELKWKMAGFLNTRAGKGLAQSDPFWADVKRLLKSSDDTAVQDAMAALNESLPRQGEGFSARLEGIDDKPEEERVRIVEELVLAQAKAAEAAEKKASAALNRSRATSGEWRELARELEGLAPFGPALKKLYAQTKEMTAELAGLEIRANIIEGASAVTGVMTPTEQADFFAPRFYVRIAAAPTLRSAVFDDDAQAQFEFAMMQESGWGNIAPADAAKAAEWYRRAAAVGPGHPGLPAAQLRLGILHEEGRGVQKSATRALVLYRLANHKGAPGAWHRAENLARGMQPKERAKAERKARRLIANPGSSSPRAGAPKAKAPESPWAELMAAVFISAFIGLLTAAMFYWLHYLSSALGQLFASPSATGFF